MTSSDVKVPRRAHKQHLSRRVVCAASKLMQIQPSPLACKQLAAARWATGGAVGGWLGGAWVLNGCWSGSRGATFNATLLMTSERGRSASDQHTDTHFPQCNGSKAHLGSRLVHSLQQYQFNWHFLFPPSHKWKPPFNCFHMANPN